MTNLSSDNFLVGLLTANISIEAIHKVISGLLPFLSATIALAQCGIAIFTLLYVYRKWSNYRKQESKRPDKE